MRFRLKRIVLVGDRGMITQARIDADLEPAGFVRMGRFGQIVSQARLIWLAGRGWRR